MRSTQYRHCSRCGLPLEDFASQEAGVGPICRKKDNTLYSRTIKGNLGLALALASTLDGLHEECQETFNAARDKFLMAFSSGVVEVDNAEEGVGHGIDARDLVKACDFACSFVHPGGYRVRTQLIELIRHLGYIGLAGVISGEASTGEAKVWFDAADGRVKLTGSSNKSGWVAMRRIPGVTLPRYRGDKTPYSVPAAQAKDFLGYVVRFWPMAEGDIEAIAEAARNHIPAPVSATSLAPKHALATLTRTGNTCELRFVWDNKLDVRAMLDELKNTVPARQRSYDALRKIWIFNVEYIEKVQQVVSKTYIGLEVR